MGVLEIPSPRLSVLSDGSYRLESDCVIDGVVRPMFFEVTGAPVVARIEPFVCALLAPAQKLGLDLVVHGAMSPTLLGNLGPLQRQFAAWWPDEFREVSIHADTTAPMDIAPDQPRGGCCCFSLGVDAFHSTLTHLDELTCLVYAHGFDTDLDASALRRRVSDRAQQAAASLGKPLIEITTNIRQITDPIVWWGYQGGGFLGALAMLLSSRADRLLIPQAWSAEQKHPWSIHPDIDRLWSTEHIRVESDALVARIDKVAAVAASPLAMRYLRVCWDARTDTNNCGRCPKCVRTQLALRAFGVVPPAGLFAHTMRLRDVAFREGLTDHDVMWYQETLVELRSRSRRDPRLEWALASAIGSGGWKTVRHVVRALHERAKRVRGYYALGRVVARVQRAFDATRQR